METDRQSLSFQRRRTYVWFVAIVAGLIVLAYFGAVRPAERAAKQSACTGNLTMIEVLLHAYRVRHGEFPPAVVYDENGEPMHSWRMLLVRSELQHEFGNYDLDEPWDGPNNRRFADKAPSCYRCPNDNDATSSSTSYVMIIRPAKIPSDGNGSTESAQNPDLIMVCEFADSDIHWMEPHDLEVSAVDHEVNDFSAESIRSHDPLGPGVIFMDLSVFRLNVAEMNRTQGALKAIVTGDVSTGVDKQQLIRQQLLLDAIKR